MKLCLLLGLAAAAMLGSGCPGKPPATSSGTTAIGTVPSAAPAATPPDPGAPAIADPLATPPPGLPLDAPETTAPAGSATYKPLPADLDARSYAGEGLMLDVIVTAVKPGATLHDPARLSYAVVAQHSEYEHQVVRGSSPLDKPQSLKLKDKLIQVVVTPRFKPQKLGTTDPSGRVPLRHEGWYDIQLRDGQGRELGRFGVTGMGWVSLPPPVQLPPGIEARAAGEGNARGQFFDYFPSGGGAALLRLAAVEHGQQSFQVEAADHTLHDINLPHAALRFLPPGTFQTTAEKRREDSHQRNPDAGHEPPK